MHAPHASVLGDTALYWQPDQGIASEPLLRWPAPPVDAGTFTNSTAGGKFVTPTGHWLDSPVAVL